MFSTGDQKGEIIQIPKGLDTSRDFQFEILWYATTAAAGNIDLRLIEGVLRLGNTINGTLPDTQQDVITANLGQQILTKSVFSFKEPTVIPGDYLVFAYDRNAASDTYGGGVVIVGIRLTGVFWQG